MANYVTYYQGQRVEITQERLADFLANNPGDLGRVGSAFYNDSDNLAYHPPAEHPASVAVSTPGASYNPAPAVTAPVYAPPATQTQAGPVGAITTPDPLDSRIVAQAGIGDRALVGGNMSVAPAVMPDRAAGPTINVLGGTTAGIPTWAIAAAAIVLVLLFIRK